jgi:hypothetical protein
VLLVTEPRISVSVHSLQQQYMLSTFSGLQVQVPLREHLPAPNPVDQPPVSAVCRFIARASPLMLQQRSILLTGNDGDVTVYVSPPISTSHPGDVQNLAARPTPMDARRQVLIEGWRADQYVRQWKQRITCPGPTGPR